MSGLGELERSGGHGVGCFVPAGSYFLRAGAAGAMVAGAWTAYSEVPRVRDREITSEEAMSRVLKNAALGAGAGVVIGAAAHPAHADIEVRRSGSSWGSKSWPSRMAWTTRTTQAAV